jgi:hypothetical protein
MGVAMTFRHFRRGARATSGPNIDKRAVAHDSSNRLLLNTLRQGLAHAIRRDDIPAADRYRRRLQQVAEPVAVDSQLKDLLTKLLSTSGLWARSADSERDETRQQLLDLVDRIVTLLTS